MALAKFIGSTWTITPSGGALTAIGGVYGCSLQGGSADIDDITVAADTVQRIRLGLGDTGTFTLNVRRKFDDVGQAALLTMWTAGNSGVLVWTLPEGAGTLTMTVLVESMPNTVALGSHVQSAITLRVTGDIT
jgi:hypothetical protein